MRKKIALNFQKKKRESSGSSTKGHFAAIASATVAALLTFLASVVTSYMNNKNQISLEERKFESNLILKAIEIGNVDQSSKMIDFYIDSGLLSDKEGKIKTAVESKSIPAFNRDGELYRESFINELFSEWNAETELPENFKIILVSVADNIMQHRWHALATDFDSEYYAEQLSFLSSGDGAIDMDERTIMKVMKQYVEEALVAGGAVTGGVSYKQLNEFDYDDVVQVRYLDIVKDLRPSGHLIIKFRLILKSGGSIVTGYWFSSNNYYFLGARG